VLQNILSKRRQLLPPFFFTGDYLFLLKVQYMSAIQLLPRYTYDDYVQWEGKWEIIYGIPYAMAPAPVPKHQYLASNLATEFTIALKKCKKCKGVSTSRL
jgi:hypothetical protein